MKISAYFPIHYGKEYLESSIKSIRDHVDDILILYTERPSYGQGTNLKNPDSKEELWEIVNKHAYKYQWVDIPLTFQENVHRTSYKQYLDSDIVLAVDADEVWQDLDVAIKSAYDSKAKNVCVGGDRWYHFWRSFNEVNRDGFYPVRFHNKNYTKNSEIIHKGSIYHMGYAQSEELTKYKISCHGHKSIPGTWIYEKWLNYQKGQTTHLHPDSNDVWIETVDFDKRKLPKVLKEHPYYNLDRIV